MSELVMLLRLGSDHWEYLECYSPDSHAPGHPYPTGHIDTTPDPAAAMHFKDAKAVLSCWKLQSTVTPERPDGKPNRPLSAHTMLAMSLDDATDASTLTDGILLNGEAE